MGIRKVNISLKNNRTLEKYKMFEKYKKQYKLKNGVVILGDLTKLDLKTFQPSKAMAQYFISKPVIAKVDRVTPSTPTFEEKIKEKLCTLSKSQYSCNQCKETFVNELQMKRHKMVHLIKNKSQLDGYKQSYRCYICRKAYAKRDALWSHIRQHSKHLQHKCKDCNVVFETSNGFQAHKTECTKRDNNVSAPVIPVPNSESSFRYRCNICLKKFEDVFEMREHKESHYEKNSATQDGGEPTIVEEVLVRENSVPETSSDVLVDKIQAHQTESTKRDNNVSAPVIPVPNPESSFRYRCNICLKKFGDVFEMREHKESHGNNSATQDSGEQTIDEVLVRENSVPETSSDVLVDKVQAHKTESTKRDNNVSAPVIPVPNPEASFRYRCNICLRKFGDVFEMREHKKSHYGKNSATQDSGVQSIVEEVSARENSVPETNSDVLVDKVQETVSESLRCDICDDIFESADSYLEHSQFHEKPKSPDSDIEICVNTKDSAETNVSSQIESTSHLLHILEDDTNLNENQDELIVNDCAEEFKPKIFVKNLQDLMPTKSNDQEKPKSIFRKKILKCDECDITFKRYRSFRRHNRIAKTKYKCCMCTFSTCCVRNFRAHFRSQHDIKFVCIKCKMPCDIKSHRIQKRKSKKTSGLKKTPA